MSCRGTTNGTSLDMAVQGLSDACTVSEDVVKDREVLGKLKRCKTKDERAYLLYLPSSLAKNPSLLLMLHGAVALIGTI